jgi:hypothetical protein
MASPKTVGDQVYFRTSPDKHYTVASMDGEDITLEGVKGIWLVTDVQVVGSNPPEKAGSGRRSRNSQGSTMSNRGHWLSR